MIEPDLLHSLVVSDRDGVPVPAPTEGDRRAVAAQKEQEESC